MSAFFGRARSQRTLRSSRTLGTAGAALALTVGSALVLTGCSGGSASADDAAGGDGALKVVATTTQLTDFAAEVGGDDIELTGLLTPGASAHSFDPSPADLLAIGEADVLLVNGLELETFVEDAVEAAGFEGEIVTASEGIDIEEAEKITAESGEEAGHDHTEGEEAESEHTEEEHAEEDHAEEDHAEQDHDHAAEGEAEDGHTEEEHAEGAEGEEAHDHGAEEAGTEEAGAEGEEAHAEGEEAHAEEGHDHGAVNPHIWTSPRLAIGMVEEVAQGLAAADPDRESDYSERADAYIAQLEELHAWNAAQFERVPEADRVLVSGHDSLAYYLYDYGIEFAGAILPSFEDNAEPSAAEIDELVQAIQERGVKAIFVESSMSPKLARTVGEEAGIQVVEEDALYADSLGAEDSEGATYLGATAQNTQLILRAWGIEPEELPASLQG